MALCRKAASMDKKLFRLCVKHGLKSLGLIKYLVEGSKLTQTISMFHNANTITQSLHFYVYVFSSRM